MRRRHKERPYPMIRVRSFLLLLRTGRVRPVLQFRFVFTDVQYGLAVDLRRAGTGELHLDSVAGDDRHPVRHFHVLAFQDLGECNQGLQSGLSAVDHHGQFVGEAVLSGRVEEIVKEGKKKYVRYAEGAELYSMGRHTFEALAKEAQASS